MWLNRRCAAGRADLNRGSLGFVVFSEASSEAAYGRTENTMRMRVLAAAGVLISGAVHLKLWVDGFRDIDVIGPAFMLNAVAGLVIAVLLILWRHRTCVLDTGSVWRPFTTPVFRCTELVTPFLADA